MANLDRLFWYWFADAVHEYARHPNQRESIRQFQEWRNLLRTQCAPIQSCISELVFRDDDDALALFLKVREDVLGIREQPFKVTQRPRYVPDKRVVPPKRRAEAYVLSPKFPASISGSGGHRAAFQCACVLVRGFDLNESEALEVMKQWNARCQPPWSDWELKHKLTSARKTGRMAFGELLR